MLELIFFLAGMVYLTMGILSVIHLTDATDILGDIDDWLVFLLVYVWPLTLLIGWSLHGYRKFKKRNAW